MSKKELKIDIDSMFYKLKAIIDADLAKLFDKCVSRKVPLEPSEANILSKHAAVLISLQKEERDERNSQADSSDNPFNVTNLKLLQATTTQEELLRLAASDDE